MRLLHTSDWHLGKSIHGQDLLEDQRYALSSLIGEIEKGYDAVLIAGDIYDRAIPPSEAVNLFSVFIERMVDLGVEVVIIPGNHDSPSRLDFASGVLRRSGIHFRCDHSLSHEPVVIQGPEDEIVHVYALPFVDEVCVKALFPDEGIRNHQDAVKYLLNRMRERMDPEVPSILVAHEYTGRGIVTSSDSERELLIGDQGHVDPEIFSGFDHVAMGHLHRPQKACGSCNIHYSGSLMPYSFSESGHEKSSLSLHVHDNRIELERIQHTLLREFTIVEDEFRRILEAERYPGIRDHYLSVKITDRGYLVDIHKRLLERFPHVLEIDQPALHVDPEGPDSISREEADDPLRLFSVFLDLFGWDEKKEKAMEIFNDVRKDVSRREVNS